MDLSIDRQSGEPIYRQVARQIQDMISTGALPDGFVLPPERRLASALGINRSTVLSAYRELKARGLVDAHVGRGTAVLRPPAPPRTRGAGVPWRQLFRQGDSRLHDPILAELLAASERRDLISLSIGLPAPELLPLDTLGEISSELWGESGPEPFLHSPTEGHTPFRSSLAEWVTSRGIRAKTSDILVVSGSQQGLDLIARTFLDPGDVVVVEEPTYLGALQAFRFAGARLVGVPTDAEGMRTDVLESVLEHHRPKLVYTLPTFQNPSGVVMSLERRRHLLDLASRWHIPILEDDPYSELRYEGEALPSLKALDENESVLYSSTFSKIVLPGLRVGYLVLPPVVLRQLVLAKQGADLHTNSYAQYLLDRFVRDGHFADHLDRLRDTYRRRRDAMARALVGADDLDLGFSIPPGGFYVWCRIPRAIEQTTLMSDASAAGVLFLPGRACFPGEPAENAIRLNFTHCSESAIETGIERLLAVLRRAGASAAVRAGDGTATAPVV
ncbi:MAG: PLP-dependent aminotransferase family protein [Holophagae bacterium]